MTPAMRNLYTALLRGDEVLFGRGSSGPTLSIKGVLQPLHVVRHVAYRPDTVEFEGDLGSEHVGLSPAGLHWLVSEGIAEVHATFKGDVSGMRVADLYFAKQLSRRSETETVWLRWISAGLAGVKPLYVLHYDGAGAYVVHANGR